MGRFSIEAFVIKTTRMTESSRVVTLFSRELGKVKGVAKGVDRPKSKMSGAIALFNLVECDLYKKESSELGTLSGASTLRDFPRLATEPRMFGFGSAWCEILDKTTHPHHPRARTFELTDLFFSTLNDSDPKKAGLLFWAGLFKILVIEGYAPVLGNCISCGISPPKNGVVVSLKRGGIVCRQCNIDYDTTISLTTPALDILRKIGSTPLSSITGLAVDKKAGKNGAEVILAFASYHLGLPRNLKSFKFLETLTD